MKLRRELTARKTMDFDQGEFSFDEPGSEGGYHRWQYELLQRKKEFESRFGILLGTRVRVQLVGELAPLEGMISLADRKEPKKRSQLKLLMGHRTFTLAQIESIGRLTKP